MDKSNTSHYKDVIRTFNYLIDTKYHLYQMKPDGNINGLWELNGYSDTYYAVDNVTRKSVTGYIVIINGAVIAWHSQSQKIVTISITETEY